MNDPHRLQLFLASPSDVAEERKYAEEVIKEFNHRVADNLGIQIVLRQWENASPDLGDPQDLINSIAEDSDLVVVIFWRRLGTPTRDHPSGTLEEFENARKRWENSGRPRVWVYFRDVDASYRSDAGPQLSNVLAFRSRFEEQRLGLSYPYSEPAGFRYLFQTHLYQAVIESVLPSARDRAPEKLPFGVMPVVSKTARDDLGTLLRLRYYAAIRMPDATFKDPVVINPPKGPVDVYAGGLSIVKERFWTTAFLDSVYWGGGHPSVLDENRRMLDRLRGKDGAARRLFIAAKPPADEANWLASYLRYLDKHGREEEAMDRKRQFDSLRTSMTELADSGFETRVGTDEKNRYKDLIFRIDGTERFSPYKFGLTLYDDKRVDIFQEGKFGLAGNVNCFTPATSHFEILLQDCERYFEELWQSAIPFREFLGMLDAER